MNMFAFYAVKGYPLDKLAELTTVERTFLHHAREQHYNELTSIINSVLKALGGE